MSHIRFVMIGGFLGAGKTTTIARLARAYQRRGKNVGIVTNDQATDLVDTQMLRSQGFDVGEVAGSCFCCNFNGLMGTIEELGAFRRPDVIRFGLSPLTTRFVDVWDGVETLRTLLED